MSRTTKRKLGSQETASEKKRKIAKVDSRQTPAATAIIRGDALRWKEVSLPDRMDDAEGFYGLEEIDDVEVVRDETNQHVMFRPKAVAVGAGVNLDEQPAGDDEWPGFGDEDGASPVVRSALLVAKEGRQKENVKKPPKKSAIKASSSSHDAEVQADSRFDVLDEIEEGQQVDVSAWMKMQLSESMLSAIAKLGFSKPTPIQSSAIPPITAREDVIGKAVTGSGKTLAFGIPILERWLASHTPSKQATAPVALILAPTRELAHQLTKHLTSLGEGLETSPRIVTVTGGLSILKQQRQLDHADIIIGTPGRLWEVINDPQGLIGRLQQIKFLVVDEADRLLSEGHFKEVEDILDTLDRQVIEEDGEMDDSTKSKRQTLVFSATFHKGLQQKLTGKLKPGSNSNLLTNQQSMTYLLQKLSFRSEKPVFIDSNPTSQMASTLRESIVECAAMEKDLYLYTLLLQNRNLKTIVFTNSISAVKRLNQVLTNLNTTCVALHSGMPQKSRLRSLERFNTHRGVLAATDVAARGLDIKDIELIIHYHVPRAADTYVHRSGRTARAQNPGRSILLCSPDEVVGVMRLVAKVHENDKAPDTVGVERDLVKRLTPRVQLAQKITDATLAREKLASKDDWLKTAAEELGVDYDSDEFEAVGQKGRRGRGGGKAQKQKQNGMVAKDQIAAWRAELRELLSKRVNMGISERYLAGGRVDVDALLEGRSSEVFLEGR